MIGRREVSTLAQKAIIVGLDGASMELLSYMVDQGHAPNIAQLIEHGVHCEMLGALPTLTPPGWTTLATGSWAGTHGITDFYIREPHRSIDDAAWGIDTNLCKAEYLWNTAERCGKIPILVKYEMSWPPTVQEGIQVEGTGPGVSNHAQIAGYHLFTTDNYRGYAIGGEKDAEKVDPSTLQDAEEIDLVSLRPAEGWVNLPSSSRREPMEARLIVRPLARGRPNMARGAHGIPRSYYALVYASGEEGYDRVVVAPERDAGRALAEVGRREWSDWWQDSFVIDGKRIRGSVRCKVVALAPDGQHLELFFPQIWPVNGGYTQPDRIASEIYENVGPFLQNPARDALGLIDDDTYFELLDYHQTCLGNTALYLMEHYDWDLLFTETHATDFANHFFLRQADPVSGAEPEAVARSYQGLVRTYEAIDRWVGQLMTKMDDDTVLVILSDHGGTPDRYGRLAIEDVLEEAGLLKYDIDPTTDERKVDWSRTKAAPLGLCNIFVNLRGREPNGIVGPEDYEAIQKQIVAILYEYQHPATGEHPFSLALTRSDAEMVNLRGDLVGDVVFALKPEYDGAHGCQMPSAKLGLGAQHTVFIMAGPGIKEGVHLQRQVRQVDVAPTISYLLGMDVPRDCEGGIIYEALDDPNWHLTELKRLSSAI